ncbi:MAG TPA: copper resistance protein CopD, partial [Phenylobacterium sp.]|nr:copper resistance protein CopD [Phenylobacterium sp.]
MLDTALVALRLAQYVGATILFGSSLFFLYALSGAGSASAAALGWPKRLVSAAAVLTLVGALLGFVVQTGIMAGSLAEGLKPASLAFVGGGTGIGRAALARAGLAGASLLALLIVPPGRCLWLILATLGGAAAAGLAWMGHGAATEGPGHLVHLVSDILHSLTAGVWVGALTAFLLLLRSRVEGSPDRQRALHAALRGFSGIGSLLVAVLVATGLVNSWFLVSPGKVEGLWSTPYGGL